MHSWKAETKPSSHFLPLSFRPFFSPLFGRSLKMHSALSGFASFLEKVCFRWTISQGRLHRWTCAMVTWTPCPVTMPPSPPAPRQFLDSAVLKFLIILSKTHPPRRCFHFARGPTDYVTRSEVSLFSLTATLCCCTSPPAKRVGLAAGSWGQALLCSLGSKESQEGF